MIHISKIYILAETLPELSITWIAEDGRKIFCPRAKMTSFHSSGQTMNICFLDSGEIRTVNRYTIIEFNGQEVVF